MRVCSTCGKGIAENTNFCPFCGALCQPADTAQTQEINADPNLNPDLNPDPNPEPSYEPANAANVYHSNPNDGLSIGGLVLGILSVVLSFLPFVDIIAIILGVIGLVLSLVALTRLHGMGGAMGKAIAGLVLSVIGILIAIIL